MSNDSARLKFRKALLMPVEQKMFMVMVGTGLLCALIIVSVFLYTQPFITKNKIQVLEKAFAQIIPQASSRLSFSLNEEGHFKPSINTLTSGQIVYAAFNNQQQLQGIVIEAQGRGYQDTIELLYAYNPEKQSISGLVILSNRETPGLGAKISYDADFLANFKQLDVSLNLDESALRHPVQVVKPGINKKEWQIDSITGATISSKAGAKIIQHSASRMLPLINQNLQDLNYASTIKDH